VTENILSWNVTNWITVVIMVAVGFFVLSLITKGFHMGTGNKYAAVGAVSQSAAPVPYGAIGGGFPNN
jgi:hypothetical protein